MLESLFNKVAGLKAFSFIKKRLQHMCFSVKFAKFFRAPIIIIISFFKLDFYITFTNYNYKTPTVTAAASLVKGVFRLMT